MKMSDSKRMSMQANKLKPIGGQALIEGVMMKSPDRIASAVRKGTRIIIKKQKYSSLTEKHRILKLPLLRGVIFLFEMLFAGMKSLTWSANMQAEKDEKISSAEIFFTILISFAAVALFFIAVPFFLTKIFFKETNFLFALTDGIFRILIFLLYIFAISFMKDIRRVFQYHGAEHKAVHCYEAGKKLNAKNVQRFSTLHPRCGTSLIIFVLIVSILLFSVLKDPRWWVSIPLRIIFVPLIAGISYEILKLSSRHKSNILLKMLIQPGLFVQKLTTKQPDSRQVEVAIAALKEVLR